MARLLEEMVWRQIGFAPTVDEFLHLRGESASMLAKLIRPSTMLVSRPVPPQGVPGYGLRRRPTNINQKLAERVEGRTLQAIKGKRRLPQYKRTVEALLTEARERAEQSNQSRPGDLEISAQFDQSPILAVLREACLPETGPDHWGL